MSTLDSRIALDLEIEILTDADTLIPELVVDNELATADEARIKLTETARALVGMCRILSDFEETVYDRAEADALVGMFESFVNDFTAPRLQPGLAVTA